MLSGHHPLRQGRRARLRAGGEEEPGDEEEAGGEDSSPPIKVNEAQSLHEIRKKVQRLMKRY